MELLLDMCRECRRLASTPNTPSYTTSYKTFYNKFSSSSSSCTSTSSTCSSSSSSSSSSDYFKSSYSSYSSCSYSSSSTGRRSLRNIFIGIFFFFLLIDISSSAIACYRDSDCGYNECCAGYYKHYRSHTRCRPKLFRNNVCHPIVKMRYVALPGGGGVFDQCGCRSGLTCKRIERKNWSKKKKLWSRRKKRNKTQFKYRCKNIPKEPTEVGEWRWSKCLSRGLSHPVTWF